MGSIGKNTKKFRAFTRPKGSVCASLNIIFIRVFDRFFVCGINNLKSWFPYTIRCCIMISVPIELVPFTFFPVSWRLETWFLLWNSYLEAVLIFAIDISVCIDVVWYYYDAWLYQKALIAVTFPQESKTTSLNIIIHLLEFFSPAEWLDPFGHPKSTIAKTDVFYSLTRPTWNLPF